MSLVARRAPRGSRATLATALVAVGTCASTLALANLLSPGGGRGVIWLCVLLLAAFVAGVRALTRTWWVPSAAGLVAAAVGVVLRYGAPPGRLQLVPTPDTWDRARAVWSDGLALIDSSVVPMDVTRPVEMVILVGALFVFLACDLLAVGLGRAGWAGLVYLAMWAPALTLGFDAGAWALLWTGAAYLLLLAVTSAPHAGGVERGRLASAALWSTAAVVVGALVLGPILTVLPAWSSFDLPSLGSGAAGPLRLSDELDMRHSLGKRSGSTVLTYSVAPAGPAATPAASSSATPLPAAPAGPSPSATPTQAPLVATVASVGPLRAFTLTEFDGRTWTPTEPVATNAVAGGSLLATDPDLRGTEPDAKRGVLAKVDVEVGTLDEKRLPIGIFPRTVDAPGSWQYDAERDEVFGSDATPTGMRYLMVVELPDLRPEDLEDATTPAPPDAEVSGVLSVPATSHSDDIAALARDLTKNDPTPYKKAMSLQSYLRASSNFTYDTRVAPASTDDAVWDFLQDKHGYCVQFATTMTVMARTLGIPARMGVGFLPGKANDDGAIVVTGKEAHTWPELYFGPDLGWVRFEPTPAVQSGAPPVWSDPFQANAPGTDPRDDLNQRPDDRPTDDAAPTDAATSTPAAPTTDAANLLVPVLITLAAVLLLAGFAVALVVSRRRARPDLTPEQAWTRTRKGLAARGIRWSDATTPRAAVHSVEGQLAGRGSPVLGAEAARALVSLATAVETERYSPRSTDVSPDELRRWSDTVLDEVKRLLSDRSRRDAAPSAPRAES